MPRKLVVIVSLLLLSTVGTLAAAERTFGEPLSSDLVPTAIEDIVADPDAWKGKRVRIEGRISGVCERQGCWIDLVSPQDASLRVKVDDGVIVFPPEIVGRQAAAEGEVEIVDLDREQYEGWLRHQAEETGEELDPADVGDGPYRIVRLKGLGASVAGP